MALSPDAYRIELAGPGDADELARLRHAVYADELGQHSAQRSGRLPDVLADVNVYLVARRDGRIVGFVSLTPPSSARFSLDKYLSRQQLPFDIDGRTYEVPLLTVDPSERGSTLNARLSARRVHLRHRPWRQPLRRHGTPGSAAHVPADRLLWHRHPRRVRRRRVRGDDLHHR